MKRERLLNEEEARRILKAGQYGVLSVLSPEGIPYGVPLNYYYDDEENAVFFHLRWQAKSWTASPHTARSVSPWSPMPRSTPRASPHTMRASS